MRRADRRGPRLPVVQCAAGDDLHGGYGLAGLGWCARCHRRRDEARDRARHRGRAVRAGDAVRDHPGCVVQADGEACLPNGPAASPLRAEGVEGIDRRGAVLGDLGGAGARGPCDAEAALNLLHDFLVPLGGSGLRMRLAEWPRMPVSGGTGGGLISLLRRVDTPQ